MTDCSHVFRDSKVCAHCGRHFTDLVVEQYAPEGETPPPHFRQHVLRVVVRYGEPTTDALRARVAELRALEVKP